MKTGKVHQRRTRFIKEYLIDQNATRAAIAAGYSEKSAKVTGHRLLTDANVQAQINAGRERISKKLEATVERVTLELMRLAFYDPLEFWNKDGSAKPLHEMDEDARRAIAGLEIAELFEGKGEERNLAGYIKKFKLADKGANLERLGRHLQMFPTKVEISGSLEIHKVEDGDLQREIDSIMQRLGIEREVNAATAVGIAQGRTEKANGKAQDTELLPR